MRTVFIGYDPREAIASNVLAYSIVRRTSIPVDIHHLNLTALRQESLYTRPHRWQDGKLWDAISDAPMSTEFALSRFLVPFLHTDGQWSVFMDSDMLCLDDIASLFDHGQDKYAVMVVKHKDYDPRGAMKKNAQVQTGYPRKNWSSLMLINHEHPAWKRVSYQMVNEESGLYLHQFRFLEDSEIGSIPLQWNFLVGDDKPDSRHKIPKIVHFTNGGPWLERCVGVPPRNYAGLWETERQVMEYMTSRKLITKYLMRLRHGDDQGTSADPYGETADEVPGAV